MILQLIGIILAILGFSLDLLWLFLIGGFLCLLLDLIGFSTGRLNPTLPIVLYIGGYIALRSWHGILWGSVLANSLEIIFMVLVGLGFSFFKVFKKK